MKKYFLYIFSAIIAFTSCDDTTDTLGMSISEATEHLTIQVSADEFNVESHSVEAPKAVSRSASGYLGKIKDPETNSIITCNYMTQQRTMGTGFQFPELDSIYVKDYDASKPRYDQILADSAELTIYFPSFFGDSLAQMTVIAHELKNAYQEKDVDKIYIDFDPDKEGKIRKDEGSIHSQVSFTYANHTKSDTELNSSAYVPYVTFSLNQPYTKDGVTYNNYGTYLMRKYFNPETSQYFNNQYDFVNKINPGFYIETLGGIGCMGKITSTRINVFFRGIDKGNPVDMYTVFAGTDEVMQKTQFTTTAEESKKTEMLTSNECTYIKTPAYIYTEITLPIEEILYCHEDDTLSTARVFVPRINDKAHSQYSLDIPKNLLLLPTDSVDNFFKSKKLADSRMYFLTTFDSKNNGYTYNNISDL
ncbi:MAG: DUF4270 domain-containing protein, partial [Prevotella sp.]|nr:DUF4270 domain-containing protein [Candidatus Prevotella equi]